MNTMSSTSSTFLGTGMPTVEARAGRTGRSSTVRTNALFSKIRQQDKKVVDRAKKSEVVKQKKLLPYDVKWFESQPERSRKQDAARNTPREGGFGQGLPYQKVKIGQKMEGTPIPSTIDPVLFALGLAGTTIFLVAGLILTS